MSTQVAIGRANALARIAAATGSLLLLVAFDVVHAQAGPRIMRPASLTTPVGYMHAELTRRDSTEAWFRFFTGSWKCAGGFPNGRALTAAVNFVPALSGKWLEYNHADDAPGTYQVKALMGHEGRDSTLVAVFHDNGGGIRLYRSPGWQDNTLAFTKDTSIFRPLNGRAMTTDRFTYRKVSDSTFWFAWELPRPNGAWAVGDSLTCRSAR